MGRPILYAHLIWNHFTAAFLRYGTLFDLEGYKDTISNKYKKIREKPISHQKKRTSACECL